MAAELAASIVAAASTLHEQHTERKILRVIEDFSIQAFGQAVDEGSRIPPRELWLVWHEKESRDSDWTWEFRSASDPPSRPKLKEVRVPLEKMLAEGWTVEREIKPAADVSYLVLARTAPRPSPGPPTGGV